jgi:hypothetical protein
MILRVPRLLAVTFATLVVTLAISAAPTAARAQDIAPTVSVELHGFVSQGFLLTTSNDYLADSDQGSFEFSEAALNATVALTDRLRTGMQLFARDLGPIGDYRATFDWFYLDYHWEDWLGVRAGRVKLPFGLYNDTSDVDAARISVLLPQSTYPTENRDFLLSLTGAELYGWIDLAAAGALEYRLNAGTIFLDFENQAGNPITVLDLKIPYIVGGRVLWETPLDGLRVGGSVQALRLETELLSPMSPMPVSVDIPAVLWVASAEYMMQDTLVAAEYGRWHVRAESSDPMVFPESKTVSERAYALVTQRLQPWLTPGVYYSILFPDVDDREGRERQQHDAALFARFDVNPHWIVKLEGHYLHGTAALSPTLNGRPREELEPDWGLFLLKTTAYF